MPEEEDMVQHKRGDAGVPDGTVNCTVCTRSQTSWGTLKLRIRMGRSHNENGSRKDSKKGSKRKLSHHKTSGKTKNQMGGCGPEGCIATAGDKRMGEKSWRHLMREAKARKGLQRHIWMDGYQKRQCA